MYTAFPLDQVDLGNLPRGQERYAVNRHRETTHGSINNTHVKLRNDRKSRDCIPNKTKRRFMARRHPEELRRPCRTRPIISSPLFDDAISQSSWDSVHSCRWLSLSHWHQSSCPWTRYWKSHLEPWLTRAANGGLGVSDTAHRWWQQRDEHTRAKCPPTTGRARNEFATCVPSVVWYRSPRGWLFFPSAA